MQTTTEYRNESRERNTMKKYGSTPTKDNTSGWDYWTRVYSDETPRQTTQPAYGRDMRISDMLASESLVRAKLLFLNVPGLPTGHRNIILALLKKELQEEMPIQDVKVEPGKWYLHFYRPEDALRVLRHFNGFSFRQHALVVRFCYPDGTFGDESALAELVECSSRAKSAIATQNLTSKEQPDSFIAWNIQEAEALLNFEKQLVDLLQNHSCLAYHTAISTVRSELASKNLSSQFVADAVSQWTTGFVRLFNRKVKVVGNTLCLASGQFYNQRVNDIAREGQCFGHRDSWEPCLPDDIRSDIQLKQYAHSFLLHFGPQHIHLDIPLRIFAQILCGMFPKTGHELAQMLTNVSAGFVIINNVLYLASYDRHHGYIIDNLSAYQEDSDDDDRSCYKIEHETVEMTSLDLI